MSTASAAPAPSSSWRDADSSVAQSLVDQTRSSPEVTSTSRVTSPASTVHGSSPMFVTVAVSTGFERGVELDRGAGQRDLQRLRGAVHRRRRRRRACRRRPPASGASGSPRRRGAGRSVPPGVGLGVGLGACRAPVERRRPRRSPWPPTRRRGVGAPAQPGHGDAWPRRRRARPRPGSPPAAAPSTRARAADRPGAGPCSSPLLCGHRRGVVVGRGRPCRGLVTSRPTVRPATHTRPPAAPGRRPPRRGQRVGSGAGRARAAAQAPLAAAAPWGRAPRRRPVHHPRGPHRAADRGPDGPVERGGRARRRAGTVQPTGRGRPPGRPRRRLVRPRPPRPAVAGRRPHPVGRAGQRGDAPADAGRAGGTGVAAVDGGRGPPRRTSPRPRPPTCCAPGAASATRAGRSGCRSAPGRSPSATPACCRAARRTCSRCPGSAPTPRRRSSRSRTAGARSSSTRTCGGCSRAPSPGTRCPPRPRPPAEVPCGRPARAGGAAAGGVLGGRVDGARGRRLHRTVPAVRARARSRTCAGGGPPATRRTPTPTAVAPRAGPAPTVRCAAASWRLLRDILGAGPGHRGPRGRGRTSPSWTGAWTACSPTAWSSWRDDDDPVLHLPATTSARRGRPGPSRSGPSGPASRRRLTARRASGCCPGCSA